MENLHWSLLLRTAQVAIEASTTLLCGLLVAGVMRRMLGAEGTRRLFGSPGLSGLLRGWAVGWLLPVCSLGAIPIAREMKRAGVPHATILAFAFAAPHINPLSLLYGLTLANKWVVICFALASLLLALVSGAFWNRFLEPLQPLSPPSDEPLPAPGLKRLLAVLVTSGREAVSSTMAFVLLGVFSTGLIASLLPHGILSTSMKHEDLFSPALMTSLAVPLYCGPLQGMMRLGLMFEHGNSVGAAFSLFELGIGLNLGLIAWLMASFGWRKILTLLTTLIALTLLLGYAFERPLYYAYEEASHTHAFDDWTNPYSDGFSVDWSVVRQKILAKVEVLEPVSLTGLGLLVLVGLGARQLDRRGRLEEWLTQQPPPSTDSPSIWNRAVPGPVLGMVALAGLVVFSVVAVYIYYPPQDQAFEEISRVRAEAISAVRSGNKEEAIRQLEEWDLLTRKLQVGVFLRTWELNPTIAKVTEDLRERLEELRDSLLEGDLSAAHGKLPEVEVAFRACRQAYLDSNGS